MAEPALDGDGRSPCVVVLVVDDQPRFRDVARAVIARTPGFRIAGEAVDGLDALDQVRAVHPDLVLMDVHMPRLDGVAAARRIAVDAPATVVVLLSSYDHHDLPADVTASGAAYLNKELLSPGALRELWSRLGSAQA